MSKQIRLDEFEKVMLFYCKSCDNRDYLSVEDLKDALIVTCDDCGEQHFIEERI